MVYYGATCDCSADLDGFALISFFFDFFLVLLGVPSRSSELESYLSFLRAFFLSSLSYFSICLFYRICSRSSLWSSADSSSSFFSTSPNSFLFLFSFSLNSFLVYFPPSFPASLPADLASESACCIWLRLSIFSLVSCIVRLSWPNLLF